MFFRSILILCWRNLTELTHQKTLIAFIIIFPLIFPLVFGAVFGGETPVEIDVGIVEEEQTDSPLMSKEASEDFVKNFTDVIKKCPIVNVNYEQKLNENKSLTETDIEKIFKEKEIDALIYIPRNFSDCIMFSVNLSIYISPTLSPDRKSLVENTMISIITTFSNHIQDMKINYTKELMNTPDSNIPANISIGNINISMIDMMESLARPINPALKHIEAKYPAPTAFDWIIAGIAGMTILWFAVLPSAEKVAADKVTGVRKRILISPCNRLSLLFGNTLSQIIVVFFQLILVYSVAMLLFEHEIHGSKLLIVFTLFITAIYCIGIGLIIGRFSKTPETASQIGMVVCFPMMFLSGIFFPIPKDSIIYHISRVLPLTYSCEIIRDVSIWGYGFRDVAGDLIVILVFTLIILTIGAFLTYRERE